MKDDIKENEMMLATSPTSVAVATPVTKPGTIELLELLLALLYVCELWKIN